MMNPDAEVFRALPLSVNVTVASQASATRAEHWNTATGAIEAWPNAATHDGNTTVPLQLPAWGTTLLVVSAAR